MPLKEYAPSHLEARLKKASPPHRHACAISSTANPYKTSRLIVLYPASPLLHATDSELQAEGAGRFTAPTTRAPLEHIKRFAMLRETAPDSTS